jgi:multicomponent Na+:H+ antiporter subunit C
MTVGLLFGAGVYLLLQRDARRVVLGLGLWANAVNLFLVAMGSRAGSAAPYAGAQAPTPDPLPQALVLTAIVISLAGLVFAAALLRKLAERHGGGDVDLAQELRR